MWASAQPRADVRSEDHRRQDDAHALHLQHHEQQIKALAQEVKALQQRLVESGRGRAAQTGSWWKGDDPPVWSNWILIIVAIVAGRVTYKAFIQERDTVRLTLRADVLLEPLSITDLRDRLNEDSRVVFRFRNFGPTRAGNGIVHVDWAVGGRHRPKEPNAALAIGGGEVHEIKCPPLRDFCSPAEIDQIASGLAPLEFRATVGYDDVFGRHHGYTWLGSFDSTTQKFDIDERKES